MMLGAVWSAGCGQKTQLVRYLAQQLGVAGDMVTSPTYVLMHVIEGVSMFCIWTIIG